VDRGDAARGGRAVPAVLCIGWGCRPSRRCLMQIYAMCWMRGYESRSRRSLWRLGGDFDASRGNGSHRLSQHQQAIHAMARWREDWSIGLICGAEGIREALSLYRSLGEQQSTLPRSCAPAGVAAIESKGKDQKIRRGSDGYGLGVSKIGQEFLRRPGEGERLASVSGC